MQLLFRKIPGTEEEFEVAQRYFKVRTQRTLLSSDWNEGPVVGRYSVLPHYVETYKDVINKGTELINTPQQHNWIADFEYYEQLL